jgi:ligand-binding SRPBCC domain-containing protein
MNTFRAIPKIKTQQYLAIKKERDKIFMLSQTFPHEHCMDNRSRFSYFRIFMPIDLIKVRHTSQFLEKEEHKKSTRVVRRHMLHSCLNRMLTMLTLPLYLYNHNNIPINFMSTAFQ